MVSSVLRCVLVACTLCNVEGLRVPTPPRPTLRSASCPARSATNPTGGALASLAPLLALAPLPAFADDTGYSQVSYNFVLFLYVISFPGIYSLVTRSVKAKVVRKTYEVPGPASE